jgi:hypothetical protein
MAHFAEIDSNNKVLRVLVVDNSQEDRGQEFLANDLGLGGTWIQTSYNANFGGKYAGIGDTWDGINFIAPVVEVPTEEIPAEETPAE